MADLKSIFGDDAGKAGKKPSLFSDAPKPAAPKIFSDDEKPAPPSVFTEADKPKVPTVFRDDEKVAPPVVFKDGDKARFCRYCRHYVVNPFTQRCDVHKREVEATDTCGVFEAGETKLDPSDQSD